MHIKSRVGSKLVLILSVKSLQVNLPAEEAAVLESSPFMSHCQAQNAVGRRRVEMVTGLKPKGKYLPVSS